MFKLNASNECDSFIHEKLTCLKSIFILWNCVVLLMASYNGGVDASDP